MIQEVIFKFDDNSELVIRPFPIGDTVMGEKAHKVWYALLEYEKGHNSSSVYKLGMTGKIEFISKRSESLTEV